MTSNPTFDAQTGALEVSSTYRTQAQGKTILITGVSPSSLGDGISRAFAHSGAATIIITGHNTARLADITSTLSASYPDTRFTPLCFDLSSLEEVSEATQRILDDESIPSIDIVVASAGSHYFDAERVLTRDGLEMHLGVNYLSTHLLVSRLLPKIRAAAAAEGKKKGVSGATRVVTVTSGAIKATPFRFSDYNFDGEKPLPDDEKPDFSLVTFPVGVENAEAQYDHRVAYGQSKTACVLLAVHLNTLFASEGIYAFSANPGSVATRYSIKLHETVFTEEQKAAIAAHAPTVKTVDQGAATVVVAALDPGLEPQSGVYLTHCQVGDAPEWATSKETAERLWNLSDDIVQEKIGKSN